MVATQERIWRAQPRQREFLQAVEDEVLYGGAAGGGKSDALLIYQIKRRVKHPGSKGLFLRRTYADLSKSGAALDRSRELLNGIAGYDAQLHRWSFDNGSFFEFGYLQYEDDKYKYQSAQYDDVCWDELTQFTESQYLYLHSRTRATVDGIEPRIRAACNPGNVGHLWVKRRFVDAAPPGTAFEFPRQSDQTQIRRGRFVPARLQDNQILMDRDPGYWDRLMALPEHERRALAYGDWDVFAGQYFGEWRREHHVCEPFALDPNWPRWRAVDYGYNAPMACLWFARAPSGTVYVYRELYATSLTDAQQGKRIKQLSGDESYYFTVGDPSMWNKQPNGTSIAMVYGQNGVPMAPGNNDRIAGWQRVHEYLRWDEAHTPGLQVFSTCSNFIRTLPALVHDEHKVEDVDSSGEDHAPDALRYGLMGASRQRVSSQLMDFEVTA